MHRCGAARCAAPPDAATAVTRTVARDDVVGGDGGGNGVGVDAADSFVVIDDGESPGAVSAEVGEATVGEVGDDTVGGATVGGATVGGATVGGATVGGATVGDALVGGATVGDALVGGATVGDDAEPMQRVVASVGQFAAAPLLTMPFVEHPVTPTSAPRRRRTDRRLRRRFS